MTTMAVLYSVPLDTLSGSAAPLSLVFETASPTVQNAFGAIAVVATINGVLIQMIMSSRVIYGLADRGQLPRALSRVSPRTQTPSLATFIVVAVIVVLSQTLPIDALAERTSQIVLVVFVLVNVALIRIKLARLPHGSIFRVPLIVPILGLVASVSLFLTALI